MKRIIVILLSLLVVLSLTACEDSSTPTPTYTQKPTSAPTPNPTHTPVKQDSSNKEKVTCSVCNGTGKVKYYYGSSSLEAALNGQDDYQYGKCTSCDGKGYIYITVKSNPSSSSGNASNMVTCPSCGKKVQKLISRKDKAGVTRTWCSDCWKQYDDIIG